MAYCRYHADIIGSSNTTDIINYCKKYNITCYTTMDFLTEALKSGIMNKAECDFFIYNVKFKGSILPCNTIDEFLQENKKL